MIDFMIVGRGLAANVLAHTFYNRQVSFKIIGDEGLSSCSQVAAGIWNPVVFKRMTQSWRAGELVPCLMKFYKECEATLGTGLITERPLIKPFTETQEKTLWKKKAEGALAAFVDGTIHEIPGPELRHCKVTNGYGVVSGAGSLDMKMFLSRSSLFFQNSLLSEVFQYAQLKIGKSSIEYKGIKARNIVFCEGHLVKNNPFFKWIPLKPAKGEVLTVNAPLNLDRCIFNRNGFIMKVASDCYKAGATYEWDELTEVPTERGAAELRNKVSAMISCNYQVIGHEAGIRPSSVDRRPIVGRHPFHPNLFVFNGLGTKGVMLAPFFAEKFVNFFSRDEELDNEVNVKRFYKLYEKEA
jgi:hypothetical protein